MSSSDSDLTSWFDSKLADLQEQIEKLGNGDVAARAPEPGQPATPAARSTPPSAPTPAARTNGGMEARRPSAPAREPVPEIARDTDRGNGDAAGIEAREARSTTR